MDYGIKNKVALVGGASRGIGRAIAAVLAREGGRVAVCARDASALNATAQKLKEETGADIFAVVADLARKEDVERALAETRSRLGEIEILIANTGGPRPGRLSDLDEKDWDAAYDLLLKSALRLIRGVLPSMQSRRWGRIIGITSVSVREPIDNLILSNIFRVGATSLYKTVAREVAKDGITVNTVLPGLTDTERLRALYGALAKSKGLSLEEFLAQMAESLPLRRLNKPEELAELVGFLCSQAASGVTGCAIAADGGQLRGLI